MLHLLFQNTRDRFSSTRKKTVLLFCLLIFFAFHVFSNRGIRSFAFVTERAPELPANYVEPYEVKSYFYKFRNSTKLHAAFTRQEYESVMELFKQITRLFGLNGITWMINDATSMGSLRHWDLIPWDDDIEILVDYEDFNKVMRIFQSEKFLNEFNGLGWFKTKINGIYNEIIKIYSKDSPEPKWYSTKKYKFPFIDLLFYNKNATYMWYMEDTYNRPNGQTWFGYNYFNLDDVFPLHLRPLGRYWLPFKKNTEEYLNKKHPGASFREFCFSAFWDHREEKPKQGTSIIRCTDVKPDYPFAYRICSAETCTESLIEDGKVIGRIELKNYNYPILIRDLIL